MLVQAGLGEGRLDREGFARAVLVTVLGKIPERGKAFREISGALRPGGLLSITEVIFDPHCQRRETVAGLAAAAGFREHAFYGGRLAHTVVYVKP